MEQLCLDLGGVPVAHGGRTVRPIPALVKDLFTLDESVPSGLVWKAGVKGAKCKEGCMAGSRLNSKSKYYLVSVRGYGLFYTHRIVYYLKHNQNPGSMVVRHTADNDLILGWQSDNGKDEIGKAKTGKHEPAVIGFRTRELYLYKENVYNLRSLCTYIGVSYGTIYQRIRRCKMAPEQAFQKSGIEGVTALYD